MTYNFKAWQTPAEKHVLMLSHHCCIRVIKQAHALRQRGWRVDSLSYRRPSDPSAFNNSYVAKQGKTTEALLGNGASIIHVHNEPDSLVHIADLGCRGRPIVYDCHDLEHTRHGYVTDDERHAFARADGIINVSGPHRDLAYSLHPWECPEAIVRSLPLRKWRPTPTGERDGVVYEGGLLPPGRCAWRDLTVPCRDFAAAGFKFDLYVGREMEAHYPNVQGFQPYHQMLQNLTRYRFGFCGHDPAHDIYRYALPNKPWEYALCGVIPLFVNLPHAAEVFGSGIVATSTQDAIAKMRECDEDAMRREVYAHVRYMDDEIDKTIALYEELL